jgi:hypothetical protein
MGDESQRVGEVGLRANLWALVVVLPWLVAMWFGLHDWYDEIQLAKIAAATSGIITRVEHDNHQRYDYRYSVHGRTYEGGEIIGGASLAVGQRVRVWYILDSPGTSQLTPFGAAGTRPVPLILCTCVALYCYFRLRKFLQGPESPYDR